MVFKMANSDYLPSSTVLCFENFKEAALYFERVLPLNMGRMQGDSSIHDVLVGYPESIPSKVLLHLIDGKEGDITSESHATRIFELFGTKWLKFAKQAEPFAKLWLSSPGSQEDHRIIDEYSKLRQAYLADANDLKGRVIRTIFRDYAASLGFEKFCVMLPTTNKHSYHQSDPSLTLTGLNLIDTKEADWRQIIDIRKDIESHRKLTRLRLFIHDNYSGRSFSYIEDSISQCLYDYEQIVKKFGFRTVLSSLSMLLDSKSLQTSISTGLIAGLFGGPLIGLSTTAAIEIGKIAVNLAEKQHELKNWKSGHELAYLIRIKEKLD